MPILYGDCLVGKLDSAADQRAGALRINAIHEDVEFTEAMRTAIDREIRDLAQFLELEIEVSDGRGAGVPRQARRSR